MQYACGWYVYDVWCCCFSLFHLAARLLCCVVSFFFLRSTGGRFVCPIYLCYELTDEEAPFNRIPFHRKQRECHFTLLLVNNRVKEKEELALFEALGDQVTLGTIARVRASCICN